MIVSMVNKLMDIKSSTFCNRIIEMNNKRRDDPSFALLTLLFLGF